ncbi:hypothetical protein ACFO5T_13265 [Dokdonia genika]|uniref:Uncharacterized protein n=1 Tax=Dokdonia genika TaxID=308113 RepID=A0ABV9LDD0_9FLAO
MMEEEVKKIARPILARLQVHFDGLIPRNLFLVNPDIRLKKVNKTYGSTSVKDSISIAFKVFIFEDQYICEYFLNADGYTEHRRYNIDRDQVEMLENFEGQFGAEDFEDDDMDYEEFTRIRKHNDKVRKLLIKKGFMRK